MSSPSQMALPDQEVAGFWDHIYEKFDPSKSVEGALELPEGALRLAGKDMLIVACGTGSDVVRAAREAGHVTAIDISANAVKNARDMMEYNGLSASYAVGDAGRSGLPESSFDVIWGSAVLHHLQHEEVADEFARILKPGGVVYMMSEPTFFNPLLKFSYETAFGKGRVGRRRKFLIFSRIGDDFEKPIEHADLAPWRKHFDVEIVPDSFMFLAKVGHVLSRKRGVHRFFSRMDDGVVRLFPFLKMHGYQYHFVFRKK